MVRRRLRLAARLCGLTSAEIDRIVAAYDSVPTWITVNVSGVTAPQTFTHLQRYMRGKDGLT